MKVFNALFVTFELENMVTSFPREHLRYFLATYNKVTTLSSFRNAKKQEDISKYGKCIASGSLATSETTQSKTTQIIVQTNNTVQNVSAKKAKTKTILSNGSILIEYLKSPSNFQMSLARCDNTDADALRFVINLGFSLPSYIYKPTRIDLKHQIIMDKVYETRKGHYKVALNTYKHHIVCITPDVLLVWDGTHLTVPAYSVEKEIPVSAIYGIADSVDVYVLEIFVGVNKLLAIDVLYTNPANEYIVKQPYLSRLETIEQKLSINPKWGVVTVEKDDNVISCLQIPYEIQEHSNTLRYMFIRPGQTVAAVGLDRQNVLIAYRRNDGHLEYKAKIPNNGAASAFLLNEPMKRLNTVDGTIAIKDNFGTYVNVFELPQNTDILVFKHYITVEFKDNVKLGAHIFDGSVSHVSEFKLPILKDSSNSKVINQEKLLERSLYDTKNFHIVCRLLNDLPDDKKEELIRKLKTSEKINDIEMNYK